MAQLEPGGVFAHYRVVERLGQGGQADAFKAEDLRLLRAVVIKMLRADLDSGAARRRFDREARLCSALDHPNIAGVHDIGELDGVPYRTRRGRCRSAGDGASGWSGFRSTRPQSKRRDR